MGNENNAIWGDYKVGDTLEDGRTILKILGRNAKACVLLIKDDTGEVSLKFKRAPSNRNEFDPLLMGIYNSLLARINSGLNCKDQIYAKRRLGSSLYRALNHNDNKESIESSFVEISEYVETRHTEASQKYYVLTAILCGVVSAFVMLVSFLFGMPENLLSVVIGIGFGSIGGAVSILQRFNSIQISRFESFQFLIIRGLSRILIGACFGVLAVFLKKLDLILPVVQNGETAFALFAFVGGFSERFIPEIVDKLTSSKEDKES